MKLNITGSVCKKIQLSEDLTSKMAESGYKIKDVLRQPESYGLDSSYSYVIRGGSDISGAPMRKYINSHNAVKESIKGRKKKLRVVSGLVNMRTSVVNLVSTPL